MGTTSRIMALGLRDSFTIAGAVGDDKLDLLCSVVGIQVESLALPCGKELIVDHLLVVDSGLPRTWRRWLTAHAIGHVLLHAGNQFAASAVSLGRQERQADDFAGWLLCADCFADCACEGDPRAAWQLAEDADVPVECVSLWLLSARRDLCRRCPAHRRADTDCGHA